MKWQKETRAVDRVANSNITSSVCSTSAQTAHTSCCRPSMRPDCAVCVCVIYFFFLQMKRDISVSLSLHPPLRLPLSLCLSLPTEKKVCVSASVSLCVTQTNIFVNYYYCYCGVFRSSGCVSCVVCRIMCSWITECLLMHMPSTSSDSYSFSCNNNVLGLCSRP